MKIICGFVVFTTCVVISIFKFMKNFAKFLSSYVFELVGQSADSLRHDLIEIRQSALQRSKKIPNSLISVE